MNGNKNKTVNNVLTAAGRRLLALALVLTLGVGLLAAGCNINNATPNGSNTTAEPAGEATPGGSGNNTSPLMPEDITFLTATTFASTRTKAAISREFRAHYSSFAVKLLTECAKGDTALVSPLSVLTALLMTANGAKGTTLDEMLSVLGGGIDLETLNQQLFNYYEGLKSTENSKFESANAIWFTNREDFKIDLSFVDVVNNTFRAQLACAPFTDPGTVDAINNWCAQHTDNMIPKVLDYTDVSVSTIMVLLNALCFDALWEEQYEKYSCGDAVFHGAGGDKTVTMMYSDEHGYISGSNETGFVKYYKGGDYAFVALLPKEGLSLDEYLGTLTGDRLLTLLDSRKGAVKAGLPKFSFDWSCDLNDVLNAMGINTAFTDWADFSGLGKKDSEGAIRIDKVIHKTHIDVDESGTRAAAVTAVIMKAEAVMLDEHKVILDRPFVYAIVDTANMLPLFIGTVNNI